MPLLKNNAFVPDTFVNVDDDAALPDSGNVIVSLARLQKDWNVIAGHAASFGVRLLNTDKAVQLEPYLGHLSLIVLAFPSFGDGRSYSIARALRLNGYRGELRAEGNVLPDQLQFMKQVGFDSFIVTDRFALQDWQAASHQMSLAYQRGLFRAAQETEVWSSRHEGFVAWEEQPHAG